MKMAYADPPYPGQAKRHYANGKDPNAPAVVEEVDHLELIRRLMDEFPDGWALSTASTSLELVLRLAREAMGDKVEKLRIMAWVKPFASFKPGIGVAYAWEPVLVWGGRKRTRKQPTVRDWVSANITLQKGTHGAKPPAFWYWLFEVLNLRPEDEFHDLFPGTGGGMEAWETWRTYLRSLA